jgi:hypothetical protein
MGNSKIPKQSTGYKIAWKKTCGKTTAEMGRQHHEGLLAAAECNRIEETRRGY